MAPRGWTVLLLAIVVAQIFVNGVFARHCLAEQAMSEVPRDLRHIVVVDSTAPILAGSQQVGEATWGERFRVAEVRDGWLAVSSYGVVRGRFVKGWIRSQSVAPEKVANELYLVASRERPGDFLPLFYLAIKAVENDRADLALDYSEQALRLEPNNVYARLARAQAWYQKSEFSQAKADCDLALSIDPQSAAAHFCLAGVLIAQKRPQQASEALDKAQQLDPADPRISFRCARAYREQNNLDKALEKINQAIRLDPSWASAFWLRSGICWAMHDLSAAVNDAQTAKRLDPFDAEIRLLVANLLDVGGQARQACGEAIEAADCDSPEDDVFYRLTQLVEPDQAPAALAKLKAWAARPPQQPDKYVRIARVQGSIGDWDAALETMRVALRLDDECREAVIGGALFLGLKGEHNQARQWIAANEKLFSARGSVASPQDLFLPAAAVRATERYSPDPADETLAAFEQPLYAKALFVPIQIEDKSVRMILDTGAPVTCMNGDYGEIMGDKSNWRPMLTLGVGKKKLFVPIGSEKSTVRVGLPFCPTKEITATVRRPREIKIGSLTIPNRLAMVSADEKDLFGDYGKVQVGGLIGLDLLEKTTVQFDSDGRAVRFFGRLPAEPGDAIPLKYSTLTAESRDPGTLVSDRIRLRVELPGKRSELFWLDTGYSGASVVLKTDLYNRLVAAGVLHNLESEEAASESKAKAARVGCLDSLSLGSFKHEHLLCDEDPSINVLGLNYIRRFIVTIDFPKQTLYMRPSQYYAQSEAEIRAAHLQDCLSLVFRARGAANAANIETAAASGKRR